MHEFNMLKPVKTETVYNENRTKIEILHGISKIM